MYLQTYIFFAAGVVVAWVSLAASGDTWEPVRLASAVVASLACGTRPVLAGAVAAGAVTAGFRLGRVVVGRPPLTASAVVLVGFGADGLVAIRPGVVAFAGGLVRARPVVADVVGVRVGSAVDRGAFVADGVGVEGGIAYAVAPAPMAAMAAIPIPLRISFLLAISAPSGLFVVCFSEK